jgi:hypothetical protein
MYLWSPLLGCDYWYLGSGDAVSFPTEAERQARLHKRAGCDCTEEEAMPIDLDEAKKRAEWVRDYTDCNAMQRVVAVEAIRLADEVERLRADNSRLRDELAQAWGLTDADTEAARTDEIADLHSKYTASQEEMTEVLTEHRKLVEALERIAVDDPRGPGEDDCIEIARLALGRTCP